MSGLSFALGSKRPASASAKIAPKPGKVSDLFGGDSDDNEEEDHPKKQRSSSSVGASSSSTATDPEVMKSAEKLAEFVAKNGRSFEEMTRLKNPGNDSPFRFLHNKNSAEYRFFDSKVKELQAGYAKIAAAAPPIAPVSQSHPSPVVAAALAAAAITGGVTAPVQAPSGRVSRWSSDPPPSDPSLQVHTLLASGSSVMVDEDKEIAKRAQDKGDTVAAMDAYMKMMAKKEADREAAEEELERRRREPLLNETSFDRRKVTAVFKQDGSRGHHMSDFIPAEELAKLLAKGGDEAAKAAMEAMEKKNAIKEDNIGHKLLQKMGWKEGEGVGANKSGIVAPVSATGMRQDNLGIGAEAHGEVNEGDDAFEQYRKRMMLGYKHRPNPLGNPRKAYY